MNRQKFVLVSEGKKLVAGQGVAPCLQDYEPRVQLYTTPRVKHIVAFALADSKLD